MKAGNLVRFAGGWATRFPCNTRGAVWCVPRDIPLRRAGWHFFPSACQHARTLPIPLPRLEIHQWIWLQNPGKWPLLARPVVTSHRPHRGWNEDLGAGKLHCFASSLKPKLLEDAASRGAWLGSAGIIRLCPWRAPGLSLELPVLFRPLGHADHSGGSLGAWEASAPTLEESSSWVIGKPGALQGCLLSWAESRGKFARGRLVGHVVS